MRTLCDVCESAAAIVFCAADEAALCRSCDEKVHLCNKLASRHIRVALADPSAVPPCDICENAPAFFYCQIDGSSLCQQCDMVVHVGGKKTHGRYLLFRQKVEFPGDKPGHLGERGKQVLDSNGMRIDQHQPHKLRDIHHNHIISSVQASGSNNGGGNNMDTRLIDLNAWPQRVQGQGSMNQGVDFNNANKESVSSLNRDPRN